MKVSTTPYIEWTLILCSNILLSLEELNDSINRVSSAAANSEPKPKTHTLMQWNTTM